ncbi:HAMP domain-containing histidine kinase [Luteolibacter arcticus]|uniref:histidine kinase n=1 Tax=Luteolibacter arcticus TaxID=1581411 RepID=A0ABT3GG30_9BACT|nr:HAMP domain-containing sensor histidine kinase [Luteolibacter arcticus]MCW1922567.1 HAMP domain-containing histidine kinase [Luteolibacter arcticus]
MRNPSIRIRLIFGSTLLVAGVLLFSKVAIYREIERSLRQELDDRLLHSANLLSKSAELEAGGVIYEWQEALQSTAGLNIEGLFQFWNLEAGTSTRSPDLGTRDLKFFHGELNEPRYENIQLADGKPARAIGFLHLPFTNEYGREEMRRRGKILSPEDYPQVIVCASETSALDLRLTETKLDLFWSGVVTLLAVWLAILLITYWTLRPLDRLASTLLKRSAEVGTPLPEIPADLPRELVPLASAFQATLGKIEVARTHEKDFAFSAAHQLRTPIAGMHAILEQAIARPRSEESLRERIGRALNVARDMSSTVDSLMSLARLRGGIDVVERQAFDSIPIIRNLAQQEAERYHGLRHLEMTLPQDPLVVVGDQRLFQVLVSILIDNAFHHSPDGGRIKVKAAPELDGLVLTVANDARGFDPEDAERIFRPFQRGRNTSVNTGGAGLGLALAKEISQRIGSSLELSCNAATSLLIFQLRLGGPAPDITSRL